MVVVRFEAGVLMPEASAAALDEAGAVPAVVVAVAVVAEAVAAQSSPPP